MLSRRHIRIKVFQSIYAFYTLSEEERTSNSTHTLLNHLVEQPDKIYKNYIRLLSLVLAIRNKAIADAEVRASKYLPKPEDKEANRAFIENKVLIALDENLELHKVLTQLKFSWKNDEDIIQHLFSKLKTAEFYNNYLKESPSFERDVKFLSNIYSKIIEKSEEVDNFFDDKGFKENIDSVKGNKIILSKFSDLTWYTDKELIFEMIQFTFKKLITEEANPQTKLAQVALNWDEDKKFLEKLFTKALEEIEDSNALVEKFAKNWDIDRIALVDRILMQMAIVEWKYFPSIPVNVTMNEYIDIAKEYSTPQSKSFVNGVLDQILQELQDQKKIEKSGRGLINSKK
jgi:transcription antitermination protein NusB